MKIFNLFKKQKESDPKEEDYELRLKNEFGLFLQEDNWAYLGRGALDAKYAKDLSNVKACMDVINILQAEEEFDTVCIVPGKPSLIVCNAKPPMGLATSLNGDGCGELVVSILKQTKAKVVEYKNTFMLKLP